MAIELDTYSQPKSRGRWIVNGVEADATTAVEVVSAPGAGNCLFIEKIVLQCETAAVDPQLQTNAATPIVIFGPIYTTTTGVPCVVDFGNYPIKLAENVALDLKAAGAGSVFVFVQGYSANV